MTNRTCAECGKPFNPTSKANTICSNKCRRQRQKEKDAIRHKEKTMANQNPNDLDITKPHPAATNPNWKPEAQEPKTAATTNDNAPEHFSIHWSPGNPTANKPEKSIADEVDEKLHDALLETDHIQTLTELARHRMKLEEILEAVK